MYAEKYFLISDYQSMELLGVQGLFTNLRVDRESLPEGFYKYSLREGDDDFFSTVEKSVWANHMGDFICKEKLDFNGRDEIDLLGEYNFTDEEVNLDEFFGEDIKEKIAHELDEFCYEYDTYEYRDVLGGGSREDVVENIKAGLSDKEYVSSLVGYFETILENNDNEHFLSSRSEQTARSLASILIDINSENRDSLDNIVKLASDAKDAQLQKEQNKEPERQQE